MESERDRAPINTTMGIYTRANSKTILSTGMAFILIRTARNTKGIDITAKSKVMEF